MPRLMGMHVGTTLRTEQTFVLCMPRPIGMYVGTKLRNDQTFVL